MKIASHGICFKGVTFGIPQPPPLYFQICVNSTKYKGIFKKNFSELNITFHQRGVKSSNEAAPSLGSLTFHPPTLLNSQLQFAYKQCEYSIKWWQNVFC